MMAEYKGVLSEMVNHESNKVGDVYRSIQSEMHGMSLPHKLNMLD